MTQRNLEELDLGWTMQTLDLRDLTMAELFKALPKLKKVFLSSYRGLSGADVEALAENCLMIEQIDFVGTGRITYESVKVNRPDY